MHYITLSVTIHVLSQLSCLNRDTRSVLHVQHRPTWTCSRALSEENVNARKMNAGYATVLCVSPPPPPALRALISIDSEVAPQRLHFLSSNKQSSPAPVHWRCRPLGRRRSVIAAFPCRSPRLRPRKPPEPGAARLPEPRSAQATFVFEMMRCAAVCEQKSFM